MLGVALSNSAKCGLRFKLSPDMVKIEAVYDGHKKCTLMHQEGARLQTDAPRDIGGEASAFSPTDLVAAGLASCILTTIAMFAERRGLELSGLAAQVGKEMGENPRRIARLPVTVTLPAFLGNEMRALLERVGHTCPAQRFGSFRRDELDVPVGESHRRFALVAENQSLVFALIKQHDLGDFLQHGEAGVAQVGVEGVGVLAARYQKDFLAFDIGKHRVRKTATFVKDLAAALNRLRLLRDEAG